LLLQTSPFVIFIYSLLPWLRYCFLSSAKYHFIIHLLLLFIIFLTFFADSFFYHSFFFSLLHRGRGLPSFSSFSDLFHKVLFVCFFHFRLICYWLRIRYFILLFIFLGKNEKIFIGLLGNQQMHLFLLQVNLVIIKNIASEMARPHDPSSLPAVLEDFILFSIFVVSSHIWVLLYSYESNINREFISNGNSTQTSVILSEEL
jgi:hypothetical protein